MHKRLSEFYETEMVKESKSAKLKSENESFRKETKMWLQQENEQPDSSITFSSSDSAKSADSYVEYFAATIEEKKTIFDLLEQTDTESLEDEDEDDELEMMPFEQNTDFLQFFDTALSVQDVSDDISIAAQPSEAPIIFKDYANRNDRGKFVNPLTGLEVDDSEASLASKSDYPQVVSRKKDEEAEVSLGGSERSASSESLMASDILEEVKAKKDDDTVADTLAAFFELEKEPEIVKKEEIDWDALLRAEKAQAVEQYTLSYLHDLIDKAVQHSEYMSPEKLLQKHLDKRRLIIELSHIMPNLKITTNVCTFLNDQVVRYFRRKKSFRGIMEDNPSMVLQNKQKLVKAKEHLDEALTKEKQLIQFSAEVQAQLNKKYKKLKQETESHIEVFENQVKQHLCREGFNRIKAEINKSLAIMSKYRQEISEVRLALLLQQHTEAKLLEQINKVNDLGNGLSMQSFTTYQAENQTLSKKIEERNADFNKLCRRCHNNIHILAHYKENQNRLLKAIQEQKIVLSTLTEKKRALREHLFSLKLQRNRIHDNIKKLRIQGGILDKPDLMFDYDQTVKLVNEKREKVDFLRQTLSLIQSKIDRIVAHCENLNV